MKLRRISSQKDSSRLSSTSIPKQLTFFTYHQEQRQQSNSLEIAQPIHCKQESNQKPQSFAPEDREHLKNAFRYICRLCFKESRNYHQDIDQLILSQAKLSISRSQIMQSINTMTNDAETISGERYFRHYFDTLPHNNQVIVVNYMIWFLKYKYLRYIRNSNNQKGKRKAMKKELYLRFKNEVMLPYLDNLLQISCQSQEEDGQ